MGSRIKGAESVPSSSSTGGVPSGSEPNEVGGVELPSETTPPSPVSLWQADGVGATPAWLDRASALGKAEKRLSNSTLPPPEGQVSQVAAPEVTIAGQLPWHRVAIRAEGPHGGGGPWTFSAAEAHKQSVLDATNRRGVLLPYVAEGSAVEFDRKKPVVVLLPGLTGNFFVMKENADRLAAAGYQVMFFVYDDRNKLVEENAKYLLKELEVLRATYGRPATVRTIGRSMGAVITSAAARCSVNPHYFEPHKKQHTSKTPFAGFDKWVIVNLDGQLDGAPALDGPFMRSLSAACGWRSVLDLAVNSRLYRGLYDTRLLNEPACQQVNLQTNRELSTLPVRSAENQSEAGLTEGGSGFKLKLANWIIRNLGLLDPANRKERRDLIAVGRWLYGGDEYRPTSKYPRARNFTLGLEEDVRFTDLKRSLREALAATGCNYNPLSRLAKAEELDFARRVLAAYARAMPPLGGDHASFDSPEEVNRRILESFAAMEKDSAP